MSDEIQEAVQIIRVAYDGVEIAMKVGSGGIQAMQKAVDVLKGMLDYEKSIGKTSMRKLLIRGGDLQVLQFDTKDMKKVEKMAKKYGILYSVLPDIKKDDGLSEIIFHSEAVPRVNMMTQKLGFGQIAPFEEYLKKEDANSLSKLMDFFQKQKKGNDYIHTEEAAKVEAVMDGVIEKVGLFAMDKQSISADAVKENFSIDKDHAETIIRQLETIGVLEKSDDNGNHKVIMDHEAFQKRIQGYQELAQRIQAVSSSKNLNLVDVTLSKKLIVNESETAVKTRIPGTWGEDVRYLWVNKENVMDIYGGKTMLTFLDRNKEYKLYDKENRVAGTMKGDALYSGHYDTVEANVRERFEKSEKQAITNKRFKEKTAIKTVSEYKKR